MLLYDATDVIPSGIPDPVFNHLVRRELTHREAIQLEVFALGVTFRLIFSRTHSLDNRPRFICRVATRPDAHLPYTAGGWEPTDARAQWIKEHERCSNQRIGAYRTPVA